MKVYNLIALLFLSTSFVLATEISDELEISLRSTQTTNIYEEANRLSALGGINHQNGNFKDAIKYYDQSISLLKNLKNKDHLNYANIIFLSAIASHKAGNSCDALSRVKTAIHIYKEYAPANVINTAQEEADMVFRPACGLAVK